MVRISPEQDTNGFKRPLSLTLKDKHKLFTLCLGKWFKVAIYEYVFGCLISKKFTKAFTSIRAVPAGFWMKSSWLLREKLLSTSDRISMPHVGLNVRGSHSEGTYWERYGRAVWASIIHYYTRFLVLIFSFFLHLEPVGTALPYLLQTCSDLSMKNTHSPCN